MSALGQRVLIVLLTDTESIEVMAREGIALEIIPTAAFRPIVEFALRHFQNTGRAPTIRVLLEEYGDVLSDNEINLEEETEESIEWALDDLKGSFSSKTAHEFTIEMGKDLAAAETHDKVEVLGRHSSELAGIVQRLQPRTTYVDMRETGIELVGEYEHAVATRGTVTGLRFGLPQIDLYTRGIRPSELAVVAAPQKMGKSYFLNFTAFAEWEAERATALFTLENSISMTQLRIACFALHMSIVDFESGTLPDEDVKALGEWTNDVLAKSDVPLHIFNPEMVNRTPQAMIQAARAHDVDSIIIDQLTFIEPNESKANQTRTYELRDIAHDLKGLISTGRKPLPCLLAHQINREGIKAAEKTGRLQAHYMADSAEVERTPDWVFGLYRGQDEAVTGRMQLQTLAARRAPLRDFDLMWKIENGVIAVRNEIDWESV